MRLTKQVRGAAVAALAATALAAWAPPALATGADGEAHDAAETATEAAEIATPSGISDVHFEVADGGGTTGDIFGTFPGGSASIVAESRSTEVRVAVPVEASGPVVVGNRDASLDVSISLPESASRAPAEIVDGVAVYVDEQTQTSMVVGATGEGARIISVLESPSASHKIDYEFALPDGAVLVARDDGSVDVAWHTDGVEVIIGTIEAPWAVDANGAEVETRYAISGTTLTQIVEPAPGAQYPITADPTYTKKWWGVIVKFNRSETQTVASGGGPCAALMARIPVAGWPLAAACGLYGAIAGDAVARGKCLRVNVYTVGGLTPWHGTC